MLSSFDKALTRVAINMKDKSYSKSNLEQSPTTPESKLSTSRLLNRPSPRQAALFIRNTIRAVLLKHFKQMLRRLMMRRICWRLIRSKNKRDMERAFLIIRNHTNQLALEGLQKFYNRHPELRILVSILNRIFSRPERQGIDRIRRHSLRRSRVQSFVLKLDSNLVNGLFRESAKTFWTALLVKISKQRQQSLGAESLYNWMASRKVSIQKQSLLLIIDTVLMHSCRSDVHEWKSKKEKLVQHAENRKQTLSKLRQDSKQLKIALDQEKAARYKLFQEHKKASHASKSEITELTKKFEKEKKEEQSISKEIEIELRQSERVWTIRQNIGLRNQGSERLCFTYYDAISRQEEEFRGLDGIILNLNSALDQFKETENFYFLSNLQLAKLVDIYEKRLPYNYEPQYYELQYENKVVAQTMRCFVRQKYEAYVNRLRRGQRIYKSLEEQIEGKEEEGISEQNE